MSNKDCLARLPESERPAGDFYETPKSLVWELFNQYGNLLKLDTCDEIIDPCCGYELIQRALEDLGFWNLDYSDIIHGSDFFEAYYTAENMLFNPPFKNWDDFIFKAKDITENLVIAIGKADYFNCYGRSQSGIWDGLKYYMPFNRKVEYRTPHRIDGLFHVGMLNTGWFVWEKGYSGDSIIKIIDVQKYATLGQFK